MYRLPSRQRECVYYMNWIGNFPDTPSVGDTITIYFSELHDRNPEHFHIALNRYLGGQEPDSTDSIDASRIIKIFPPRHSGKLSG